MPAILQYEFMLRALAGGTLVGVLGPLLGMFIVLRRFSLIADTLAHVALMGVAIGLATKTFPSVVAVAAASLGAIMVEQLRSRGRLPGDVAMAVVLYGALAFAVVVIGIARASTSICSRFCSVRSSAYRRWTCGCSPDLPWPWHCSWRSSSSTWRRCAR